MTSSGLDLVLLPGLDGTGDLFHPLVSELNRHGIQARAVRYPPLTEPTYEPYISIALQAIRGTPVVLLGESFSGPVAVEAARRHPERVKGLILAATFLKNPWPRSLIRLSARGNPAIAPLALRDRFLMGRYRNKNISAQVSAIVATMPDGVRASRLRAVANCDVGAAFQSLTCPVLGLHGSEDWVVFKGATVRALAKKPGARMIEVPGPHMLLQTRVMPTAAAIAAFLKSVADQS